LASPIDKTEALGHLIDRAVPPENIADVIVDFVPRSYLPLHIASRTNRSIEGSVVKLERGPAQFLEREPSMLPRIVQPANTLIAPLQTGVPVKLFLKLNPKTGEYYPIAIFPITYTIGSKQ